MSVPKVVIEAVRRRVENWEFQHSGFHSYDHEVKSAEENLAKAQQRLNDAIAEKQFYDNELKEMKDWLKENDPEYDTAEPQVP